MSSDYFRYTIKARLDKAINTLLGILEGITADQTVSAQEWTLLSKWVEENKGFAYHHPYNELVPRLIAAMADGLLSDEEHKNMIWLCEQLRSLKYYKLVTSDAQRLQAILSAIASDGVVSEAEVKQLSTWLAEHEHLHKCWPYEEVDSLIISMMQDHWIDPKEQKMLLDFFSGFIASDLDFETSHMTNNSLPDICAVTPEIIFEDHRLCFTGDSIRATRAEMKRMALNKGAKVVGDVSPRVDYIIAGSKGNPCWAYACYGRKIEKAMQLRQRGSQILIVHEVDFFNALA
jgi:NAD-dependent DNA ligase